MANSPLNARQVYKTWLNDRVVDAADIPWLLGDVPNDREWSVWDAHLACASVGVATPIPAGLAWMRIAQQVMHLAFEVDAERIFDTGSGWRLVVGNGYPHALGEEPLRETDSLDFEEVHQVNGETGEIAPIDGTAAVQAVFDASTHALSEDDRFLYAGQAAVAAFGQTPLDATVMDRPEGDVVATCSDDGVVRLYDRTQLQEFATDFEAQQGYSWPTLELVPHHEGTSAVKILGGDRISDVVHVIEPSSEEVTRIPTGHHLPDVEVQRIHPGMAGQPVSGVNATYSWATRAGGSIYTWAAGQDEPVTRWHGPAGEDINSWLVYHNTDGALVLCAHLTAADDLDGLSSWLGWWNAADGKLLKRTDLPGYAELVFTPTCERPTDFVACIQDPPRITHWDGENHELLGEASTSTQCFATASATPTPDGTIALVTPSHIEWYSTKGGLHECLDVPDQDAGIRQQMAAGPFGRGVALGALPDGRTYYAWLEGLRSVVRFVFSDKPHDLHSAFLTWIEPVAFTAVGEQLLVRGVHGAALLDLTVWAGHKTVPQV